MTTRITKLSFAVFFAAFVIIMTVTFTTTITTPQAYATTNDRAVQTETIDLSGETINSGCGENGGEVIELSGTVHVVSRFVQDESGGHLVQHVNWQGVRGEGQTTGAGYRIPYAFNSITNYNIRPDTVSGEATDVTSFHIVSQDESAQEVLVSAVFHITVNGNGEVTTEIGNLKSECR